MSANNKIVKTFKHLIPKLSKELHKGQNGRIGIVGGSKEYSNFFKLNLNVELFIDK